MRTLSIAAALLFVGLVGAFLLYVSVLTIITTIVIVIGLVATLTLGYWAGLSCRDSAADRVSTPKEISARSAANLPTRMHMVGVERVNP